MNSVSSNAVARAIQNGNTNVFDWFDPNNTLLTVENAKFRRFGDVCMLDFSGPFKNISYPANVAVGSIPADIRPRQGTVEFACVDTESNAFRGFIDTNGYIRVYGKDLRA